MDSLPPVEPAQFSSSPSVGVQPIERTTIETTEPPSRSSKKVMLTALTILLVLLVGVFVFWLITQRGGVRPRSITQSSTDQFSQTGAPLDATTPSVGNIITETTGDVREDSPGFVGGKASDENSANADGCTLDTQECSDGSFVERQGPSCEFAACPAEPSFTTPANWMLYKNTRLRYAISIPSGWVIRENGGQDPARPDSLLVLIFRPGEEMVEDSFPGMLIGQLGELPEAQSLESVTRNGISMRQQPGHNGMIYYVPISKSQSEYIMITGADGTTGDAERDDMLRQIFATFQVF